MTRFIFSAFLLLVIVFGLAFAVENAAEVEFHYFLGSWRVELSFLLALTALLGAVLGIIASLGLVLRLKREIRALRKREATAREEIRNLRSIPIKDAP